MMNELQNYMSKIQSMEDEFEKDFITDVAIDSNLSLVVENYTSKDGEITKMFLPYFNGVLKAKDGRYIDVHDLEYGFFIDEAMHRALAKWVFENYSDNIELYVEGNESSDKSWRNLWNGKN